MSLFSRNKIGLALGGGGARGIAHIGVLKVLEEYKIPIDFIAGSSAGALIGGLYAATKDLKSLENIVKNIGYKEYIKTFLDPSISSGLIKGEKIIKFLKELTGSIDVKKTKIPFTAVATDIKTGKAILMSKGSLAEAIRASISFPGVFAPFKKNQKFLVDGGLAQPVPVEAVRKMGAKKIIAVNLGWKYFPPKDKNKGDGKIPMTSILYSSFDIMSYKLAKQAIKKADINIEPRVPNIPLFKFYGEERLIKVGEEATREVIEDIQWIAKKKFFGVPYS